VAGTILLDDEELLYGTGSDWVFEHATGDASDHHFEAHNNGGTEDFVIAWDKDIEASFKSIISEFKATGSW